jgi:riboflavin-specific deaminase-like protein
MRQLLPKLLDDVDPDEIYAADERVGPTGRPWVMTNMVATVDGAASIEGVSGGIGGPADAAVFGALRAVPDVILVGAGTVRAEGYGPARTTAERQRRREARGQEPYPHIAVVTGQLDLDLNSSLFTDSPNRPMVVTTSRSSSERRDEVARVADVVVAGDEHVDLARALSTLAGLGVKVVLCEGGPNLNGQLVAAGLLDEVCVTIAPLLAGSDASRIMHGPTPTQPEHLRLTRILEQDGTLLLRYVRT